jgi:hypothetical protein
MAGWQMARALVVAENSQGQAELMAAKAGATRFDAEYILSKGLGIRASSRAARLSTRWRWTPSDDRRPPVQVADESFHLPSGWWTYGPTASSPLLNRTGLVGSRLALPALERTPSRLDLRYR